VRLSAPQLCRCALMASLIALCSQLMIPLPPIPFNLALFAVYLSGLVLGRHLGVAAVAAYLFMGFCGLPIFAGFQGGPGALLGPTGGFLIGYLPCAWFAGHFKKTPVKAMVAGLITCCALGTLHYMLLTQTPLWTALTVCVFPFLLGDGIKIFLAAIIAPRLKKAVGSF